MVAREEASDVMPEEERGRDHAPQPGAGIEAGRVVSACYEDDGAECWTVEPYPRSGPTISWRVQFSRDRLVAVAARTYGHHEGEIALWLDVHEQSRTAGEPAPYAGRAQVSRSVSAKTGIARYDRFTLRIWAHIVRCLMCCCTLREDAASGIGTH
jgi:hypothetical protein